MAGGQLGEGTVEWLGVQYRTILGAEATGGAMSIVDSLSPGSSGPPRHIHHDADETFVIFSGRCEFWVDGARFVRGVGEATFVPRGTEHTFRVIGSEPCRHLVILTPGGFERFFAEMAAGGFRIPEDMDAVGAAAARHHLTFTGPPLADG
jgi:mannose-6-phosphate isomerase-like protein (cupin superfamily)